MVLLEFGLNSFEENIKKDSAIALFWATNSVLAHDGSSHRFNASGPCNSEKSLSLASGSADDTRPCGRIDLSVNSPRLYF